MGRAEIRALIRPVRALIRTRCPSNWVAHTEPAPTARSHPSAGKGVGVPTSRLEPGSMRETVHGREGEHGIGPRLRTQTDPSPAATLKGCGTGMRTPTEGSPLGVVAGGWPVQPTATAARSLIAVSQRQPRSQLLAGARCPGSTRLRRASAGQHGGGSIASPVARMAPRVTPPALARFAVVQASSADGEPCAVQVAPQGGRFQQLWFAGGTSPGW
jgi:hypothetical protein